MARTILKGLTKKLYLVILSRRKTSFYAIFHSGSLFLAFPWHYNTRSKRFSEEIIYCPRGKYAIFHSGSLLHGYGIIIQEVKGLTKKLYFVLLSRRKTSFYAKFRFIVHIVYMVVACIIMYCQHYQ